MANAVEKLNTIAIANIEALNGITDANLEDLNGLEFSGYDPGDTWTAGGTLTAVKTRGAGFGLARSAIVSCGGFAGNTTKLATTEEYDGSNSTSGNVLTEAKFALVGTGSLTSGLVLGGTVD